MIQQPSSASYSAIVRVILRGGSGGGGGSSSRRTAAGPTSSSIFLGGRSCSLLVSSTSNGANSASAIMESRNNTSNDARLLFSTRRYSSSSFSSTIANNNNNNNDDNNNNNNDNHDEGRRPSSSEHRNHEKKEERIRKAILSAALHRVHDMGWTDDAIANGVLDCAYPPSYIGRVLSSHRQQSSPSSNDCSGGGGGGGGVWGNGRLVAHFMEGCNNNLRDKLLMSLPPPATSMAAESGVVRRDEKKMNDGVILLASRINNALRLRLSMVLPYVHSKRWHEGMAIGALPQNAVMTMSQLNDMADIVLSYATTQGATTMGGVDNYSSNNNINSMHKVAIIAAYAAAELHLLSSNVTTSTTSLSGDRYDDTWTFLEARSTGAAHVIINGGIPSLFDNLLPKDLAMITSSNIQAASAMTSSLLGAILSLATPATASMIGRVGGSSTAVVLPQVLDSVIGLVQSFVGTGTTMTQMMNNANSSGGGVGVDSMMKRGDTIIGKMKGDGTRPSDYAAIEETLPPFDTKEEIFLAPSAKK